MIHETDITAKAEIADLAFDAYTAELEKLNKQLPENPVLPVINALERIVDSYCDLQGEMSMAVLHKVNTTLDELVKTQTKLAELETQSINHFGEVGAQIASLIAMNQALTNHVNNLTIALNDLGTRSSNDDHHNGDEWKNIE